MIYSAYRPPIAFKHCHHLDTSIGFAITPKIPILHLNSRQHLHPTHPNRLHSCSDL